MSGGNRVRAIVGLSAVAIVMLAAPAFGHSGFAPDSAGAGQVAALQLSVANERSDAGTVKVQLQFPVDHDITLAALPPAPGWTTSVQGGAVGGPVTGVTWTRPAAEPEDVTLPITVGPLPTQSARLQFKLLQTYSNGEIDRWIQEWPEGAPEPDRPGPLLQVTGGSVSQPSTVPLTVSTTTVPSPVSSTTTGPASTAAGSDASGSDASGAAEDTDLVVPIVIAIAVLLGAGLAFFLRRRRA